MMTKKKIGAGVIAIDKDSGQILLGRRGMDCTEPNTWTPFGGTFDDEDGIPKQTAKREFWEEAGVNAPYHISKKPFYVDSDRFLDFYTYIGIFQSKFQVTINDESLGYGWFDLENMPGNLHPGFERLLKDKRGELKSIIKKLNETNY